jgi:large subunit ribosomal protein L3
MSTNHKMGLVGRKAGMSRLFTDDGRSIPVTLIEASPNRITQIKTDATDGYTAVQVTAGSKRAALFTKPLAGHYAKAKVEGGRGLWEFRVEAADLGKRHNFKMGDATHGNSLSHRSPGSIGQRQTPGRVFPGKKMSGHMGAVQQSTQNLEVVKVDAERGLIAIRGAVPGAPGGNVIVRPTTKG